MTCLGSADHMYDVFQKYIFSCLLGLQVFHYFWFIRYCVANPGLHNLSKLHVEVAKSRKPSFHVDISIIKLVKETHLSIVFLFFFVC